MSIFFHGWQHCQRRRRHSFIIAKGSLNRALCMVQQTPALGFHAYIRRLKPHQQVPTTVRLSAYNMSSLGALHLSLAKSQFCGRTQMLAILSIGVVAFIGCFTCCVLTDVHFSPSSGLNAPSNSGQSGGGVGGSILTPWCFEPYQLLE